VDNVEEAATDSELVRAVQAGDRAAFDLLVQRHERQIYRLCYRFVGTHEDASELAQDAFVRAYRSIGGFKADAAFATWLYRIAVNVCLNRKALKGAPVDPLADAEQLRSTAERPDSALVREQDAARVRRAIRQLPDKQRATLVLRTYHDLPHEEIAQVLGTTSGASKANFFHALKNLKRLLQNDE
jgi:RNA polymerase sigma-70 factor (ECF subfamily)